MFFGSASVPVVSVTAPASPSVSIDELIVSAKQAVSEGNISQSINTLLSALELDSTHHESNSMLGALLLSMQKFEVAEEFLFSAAASSNWTDVTSVSNLAISMRHRGAIEESLTVLKRGLAAVNNQDATGTLNIAVGELMLAVGNYTKAADWFLSAALLKQTDVSLWIRASTVRFPAAGFDYVFAQNVLTTAIKAVPQNSDLYYHLGLAAHLAGRLSEALLLYEVSMEFNPNNFDAVSSIATIYHAQDKLVESIPFYNRALELQPENVVLNSNVAILLKAQGQQEQAVFFANRAIQFDRNSADAIKAYNFVHKDVSV